MTERVSDRAVVVAPSGGRRWSPAPGARILSLCPIRRRSGFLSCGGVVERVGDGMGAVAVVPGDAAAAGRHRDRPAAAHRAARHRRRAPPGHGRDRACGVRQDHRGRRVGPGAARPDGLVLPQPLRRPRPAAAPRDRHRPAPAGRGRRRRPLRTAADPGPRLARRARERGRAPCAHSTRCRNPPCSWSTTCTGPAPTRGTASSACSPRTLRRPCTSSSPVGRRPQSRCSHSGRRASSARSAATTWPSPRARCARRPRRCAGRSPPRRPRSSGAMRPAGPPRCGWRSSRVSPARTGPTPCSPSTSPSRSSTACARRSPTSSWRRRPAARWMRPSRSSCRGSGRARRCWGSACGRACCSTTSPRPTASPSTGGTPSSRRGAAPSSPAATPSGRTGCTGSPPAPSPRPTRCAR